jgi:ethanolamine utilization cobalamin adenosyltransferase
MLTHPLRKDQLRALLLQEASRLTPSAERKAIEWAIAAHLIDEQGLTIEGRLVEKDSYPQPFFN